MKTSVTKWGNSLGVRIPKILAREVGLEQGVELQISIKEGGILLQKSGGVLQQLLEKITPQNQHKETDWGKVHGKEIDL